MKFIKKPVAVEALLVEPGYKNLEKIVEFVGADNLCPIERRPDYILKIKTLEGDMAVGFGDYIIKGVSGEFYPCKPDIFEKTYIPEDKIEEISDGYHTFKELYEHRITLFIAFCKLYEETREPSQWKTDEPPLNVVWRSKLHHDGSAFGGWFIMGINQEKGKQISYHLPMDRWEETDFAHWTLDKAPKWDGHTPADVLERLKNL